MKLKLINAGTHFILCLDSYYGIMYKRNIIQKSNEFKPGRIISVYEIGLYNLLKEIK